MKKNYLFFAILLLLCVAAKAQNIITVDNNFGSGAMYSNLQSAIDAAANGDIIYISASATNYGMPTVDKTLKIYGAGHTPDNQYGLKTSCGFYLEANSDNTEIYGIYGSINIKDEANGIKISRCAIEGFAINNSDNLLFTGNVFHVGLITLSYYADNCTFANNFFHSYRIADGNATTIFKNNIFRYNAGYTGSYFYNCNFTTIFNNIFLPYSATPPTGHTVDQNCYNCSLSNNLTYSYQLDAEGQTLPIIPTGTNTGTNNLNNTNPEFVNAPAPYDWNVASDFNLAPTSAGNNYGTDGADIGVYGGQYLFVPNGVPAMPQIYYMMIDAPVIQLNGTLQIDVDARKKD